MVSHRRRPVPVASTRDRILAAALEEFAARGFDGAKVDRIAAEARVNKAMLYYHFRSKRGLFLEILRTQFAAVAAAVETIGGSTETPAARLRRFADTIARQALARPHFPRLWLRELADGGRHVDASVIVEFRRILAVLAGILADGQRLGVFAPAHPFVVQMGIVAPLMFFAASAPLRQRAGELAPPHTAMPALDSVIEYVQASTLSTLATPRANRSRSPRRPSR